jgi:O-antigen ligase
MLVRHLRGTRITYIFIALAILLTIGISASGLVVSSEFSPVYIGLALFAMVVFIYWLRQPVWALFTTIFIVLLPLGLIPANIHSYLNRIIAVAALITWGFDWILHHCKLVVTTSSVFMIGFILWGAISIFWAHNLKLALNDIQIYVLRFIVFLFLVTNQIRTRHDLNILMAILVLNGLIYAGSGVFEILTQGYEPGSRLMILGENENGAGAIFLLTLLGGLWSAMQSSKKWSILSKFIVAGGITVVLILTLMTGSRGSALSILVAFLMFLMFRPTRFWGVLGIILIIIGLFVAPFLFNTTINRFISYDGSTPLGGREILWDAAWRLILDHPIIGVGIGNSEYIVSQYLGILPSDVMNSPSVHNPLLSIWSELGFVGIILYLGILLSALWSLIRGYQNYLGNHAEWMLPYYPIMLSVFAGYLLTWIKSGGAQMTHTYFLFIGMLFLQETINEKTDICQ